MTTHTVLLILLAVLRLAACSFPEEPGPLISTPAEVARRYPLFLGRAHRSYTRQEPLYIQTVLKVNRTLYIGARISALSVSPAELSYNIRPGLNQWTKGKCEAQHGATQWGSSAEECRNYMKVLLNQHGGLFVCGTNAFNPLCANYTVSGLIAPHEQMNTIRTGASLSKCVAVSKN
ncbi:Semaphorin-6B [Bagarius yarrelli]|uniref:Semaphorin-6B n=1 Tax=Bagarius yarrelli TaxID=175774 RepID=A0A556UZC0_BAGYA|nr:Semaphorin-6B [Bagarius yarrelli]